MCASIGRLNTGIHLARWYLKSEQKVDCSRSGISLRCQVQGLVATRFQSNAQNREWHLNSLHKSCLRNSHTALRADRGDIDDESKPDRQYHGRYDSTNCIGTDCCTRSYSPLGHGLRSCRYQTTRCLACLAGTTSSSTSWH